MYVYRLITLLVIGCFILSPTIVDWWVADSPSWYAPWSMWLLLIVICYWLHAGKDKHES